jgi:glucose-1-phosphate cytidylyltransferase
VKVVLFCGGQGLRLREYNEAVPKPMVPVGSRPILWHVMRYFAHHGHTEFVLCLGYRAEVIKDYFLRYNEALSNDFVLSGGGREVEMLSTDITDWRITFADTGLHANIGQRLCAVRKHLGDDELFLANYGDTLTDAPLGEFVETFKASGKIAAFLAIRPTYSFHVVDSDEDGTVRALHHVRESGTRINGGYFIFRRELFDWMRDGEELVEEPFQRLADAGRLMAFRYDGFWAPMDTLKDKQDLDQMWDRGDPAWALWRRGDETP